MTRPSDREYALKRKIKDLEEKNRLLEIELLQLKKKLEKMEQPDVPVSKKKKKATVKELCCPSCEASVKITELPFGKLQICSKACGWRLVKRSE